MLLFISFKSILAYSGESEKCFRFLRTKVKIQQLVLYLVKVTVKLYLCKWKNNPEQSCNFGCFGRYKVVSWLENWLKGQIWLARDEVKLRSCKRVRPSFTAELWVCWMRTDERFAQLEADPSN